MPIRLNEVQSVPDILSPDRVEILFGTIPGVTQDTASSGGMGLRLKGTQFAPPELGVGHVRVPFRGGSRAWPGLKESTNQFSCSFYEDVLGGTYNTLALWQNKARSFHDYNSGLPNEYAIDIRVIYHGTSGMPAMDFSIEGVWPITIRAPDHVETSGPAIVAVVFSYDFFEPAVIKAIAEQRNNLIAGGL